ncbi:hypothetical protein ACFQZO_07075 [Bradyrhizobium sp. GCM10027634]|uniref:hypothetical protein n=1 Tax=unclassified Bradyrhizobium TaxID=2631580 RepID=UPI00188A7645|nr:MULTISPECIES: hypothetical protein [unclassified Bradyrhizobium]MDN5000638.1 hypothetical protein [Bradyrhizobium sp. WYCCWR 12677]
MSFALAVITGCDLRGVGRDGIVVGIAQAAMQLSALMTNISSHIQIDKIRSASHLARL